MYVYMYMYLFLMNSRLGRHSLLSRVENESNFRSNSREKTQRFEAVRGVHWINQWGFCAPNDPNPGCDDLYFHPGRCSHTDTRSGYDELVKTRQTGVEKWYDFPVQTVQKSKKKSVPALDFA